MPQLLSSTVLLVGTGTPTSPGNLSVIPLKNLEDLVKGFGTSNYMSNSSFFPGKQIDNTVPRQI